MKKFSCLIIILFFVFTVPISVSAARGCCSHHGGVVGCGSNGKQICADGTYSPTCTCTPPVINVYGCTDSSAKNYNSSANRDDGSCKYYVTGCTDKEAKNYSAEAEKDDGSCEYYIYGCMDEAAINYNESAEKDDGSCEYAKAYLLEESEEINASDDSNGFTSLLTIGAIGTGVYYFRKKKKLKKKI